ncbi:MAG TPA: WD40 repeat domain-containing protein [Cyclobacteriaceae bacterium]|nr:WD40 repeat domain-containing protein [Cyclobacteriaceae bacterium]
MKNVIVIGCMLFSTILISFGQTNSDDIKECMALAKACEARAVAAENAARIAETDAKNKRYMAVALEMAEQSLETPERELAALLAVLSHNFNKQYAGTSFNNKIYAALSNSLIRYNVLNNNKELTKSLGTDIRKTSAVLPNSQTKIEGDPNGNLRFVNEGGMTIRTLSGHKAQVDQIIFNHDGSLLITAGKDNTIRVWNIRMLNLRPLVIYEKASIGNLTVSPNDKQIIYTVGTKPKTINVKYLDTEIMAAELCKLITRNLTSEEWMTYVGADLDYEVCCQVYPPGK